MKKVMEQEVKNLKAKMEKVATDESLSKSAKMKAMFDMGAEIKDIATLLQVRYNFVYNVISNYVIVNGLATTQEKKESKKDVVWKMLDEGKTVKEIAVELKSNMQYIHKLKKEWTEAAKQEVEKMEQEAKNQMEGGAKNVTA
jgi:hypothetical protein